MSEPRTEPGIDVADLTVRFGGLVAVDDGQPGGAGAASPG